jgi:threonine aldolase
MVSLCIDLRSDTVTKPSNEMRVAASNAMVGDDVYDGDPTVMLLESRVATMFGKESALFCPSGTMCNLTAIMSWCNQRGSEIIVGADSHIFLFEQGGASQFGGVSMRTLPNLPDGTMNLELIKTAIRDDDIHEPKTSLICIENTHNVCGGKVLPLRFFNDLSQLVTPLAIPIHLDGARIWNALTAMNIPPKLIGNYVDSISVCLSKGLGAPIGSILIGSSDFIIKARRIRKALGGGMRQIGMMAAAGLVALDDFEAGILARDHQNLTRIVTAISTLKEFTLHSESVDTNILFLKVKNATNSARLFKERGILVSNWSSQLIRIVIHRDISDSQVDYVIESFKAIELELATV